MIVEWEDDCDECIHDIPERNGIEGCKMLNKGFPCKCAEIEVEIDIEEYEGTVCINLCGQCLSDALEEIK